jgi:hypothetical protein
MDDDIETLTWLQEERSLDELSHKFPEEWKALKDELARRTRTNPLNSYLLQKLLFGRGNERKPVSLFWFRVVWPLLWQRKLFLDSIELRGLYCFYSKALINELTKLIGTKPCLEIAAGDGTLARFLENQGSRITATDNQSWKFAIQYPETVVCLEVEEALKQYQPETVLCSWPPRNNDFEDHIFKSTSVQTYIVISSELESASGNWATYRNQNAFSFTQNKMLSKLVLPPELKPAVYIFRRKYSAC